MLRTGDLGCLTCYHVGSENQCLDEGLGAKVVCV